MQRLIKQWSNSTAIIPVLAFLHGVLVMALLTLVSLAHYEDGLYDQIVSKTLNASMNDSQKALALLHQSHALLKPRQDLFGGMQSINLRDSWFRSADTHLIDARGACGSYAHVLGRLMQRAGFEVRIAQMKCGDLWGCHIVLEAKVNGQWAVLDGLYDLAFEKENGALASFKEVGANWTHYQKQLPDNYDSRYAYEAVRYTNWDKVPVLMPAIKHVLGWMMGEEVKTLSIRAGVLNLYKAYAYVLVGIYVALLMLSYRVIRP